MGAVHPTSVAMFDRLQGSEAVILNVQLKE